MWFFISKNKFFFLFFFSSLIFLVFVVFAWTPAKLMDSFSYASPSIASPSNYSNVDLMYYQSIKNSRKLQLNYYYDQSDKWVKFSDWIPKQLHKYSPQFLEDIYELYGLTMPNRQHDIHRNLYFLHIALAAKYRHASRALCHIESNVHHHKYRLLMHMHIHVLISRLFLKLGALYDKKNLYDNDLDIADDLEKSFLIARTYYYRAIPYMQNAESLAQEIGKYPFYLDLASLETEAFQIRTKEINYERIITRHIKKAEAKLLVLKNFLDKEGRPRAVKGKRLEHIRSMYDDKFKPHPLDEP